MADFILSYTTEIAVRVWYTKPSLFTSIHCVDTPNIFPIDHLHLPLSYARIRLTAYDCIRQAPAPYHTHTFPKPLKNGLYGQRTKAVTIRDVVQLAKVSQSTVSRVLNSSAQTIPIGEKTRQRVLDAVAMLGYSPTFTKH